MRLELFNYNFSNSFSYCIRYPTISDAIFLRETILYDAKCLRETATSVIYSDISRFGSEHRDLRHLSTSSGFCQITLILQISPNGIRVTTDTWVTQTIYYMKLGI